MVAQRTFDRGLLALIPIGAALLLWLALVRAPTVDVPAPSTWKLFFVHVPIAFLTFVAFGLAFAHALAHLFHATPRHDRAAHAAVEVGLVFALVTLATGIVWAQPEWDPQTLWSEPKFLLVVLMAVIYAGALYLRHEIEEPEKRARVFSVYAVAAFPLVPLTWFSHRVWRSYVHPIVLAPERSDAGLETPGLVPILLVAFAVFTLVFLHFYRWRRRIAELETSLEAGAPAGPP